MEVTVDGPGAYAVRVVGVAQYQGVLEAAAQNGDVVEAVLAPEDDNPYDDQAIAVLVDGARAGYLSRDDARRYRTHLAALGQPGLRVRCAARITGGFEAKDGGRVHYGLRLDLPKFTSNE